MERPATAYGWQRLPDHDRPGVWAWEQPCGLVVWSRGGVTPRIEERNGIMLIAGAAAFPSC